MNRSSAEIIREYGPFPGADSVHGVTYDGEQIWFAAGDKLNALDPASGKTLRTIDVAAMYNEDRFRPRYEAKLGSPLLLGPAVIE